MESMSDSLEGYTQPRQYKMPRWTKIVVPALLAIVFVAVGSLLGVRYSIETSLLSNLIAIVFAVAASGFLHESAHYVVTDYVGLEPEFVWSNEVQFGVHVLPTGRTVASLLVPQALSILYVGVLYVGVSPAMEVLVVWAFALNLVPALSDVCWAIRRLTWPTGTVVVLSDGESHVAFPEN